MRRLIPCPSSTRPNTLSPLCSPPYLPRTPLLSLPRPLPTLLRQVADCLDVKFFFPHCWPPSMSGQLSTRAILKPLRQRVKSHAIRHLFVRHLIDDHLVRPPSAPHHTSPSTPLTPRTSATPSAAPPALCSASHRRPSPLEPPPPWTAPQSERPSSLTPKCEPPPHRHPLACHPTRLRC
jgi:hypothetical protein